jgi:hypothetical protein
VPDDRPLGVYTVPFDAASLAQAGALSGLTVALTGNARDFVISTERIPVASSVATEDTVLFGFGIEALATQEERASVLGAALRHLLG